VDEEQRERDGHHSLHDVLEQQSGEEAEDAAARAIEERGPQA
jgi:hypothetical protein